MGNVVAEGIPTAGTQCLLPQLKPIRGVVQRGKVLASGPGPLLSINKRNTSRFILDG